MKGRPVLGVGPFVGAPDPSVGENSADPLAGERTCPRRSTIAGPPVITNPPGVFEQTGGRRVLIRANRGPRSGKMGNRSPQKARIGMAWIADLRGGGEDDLRCWECMMTFKETRLATQCEAD